MLDLWAIRSLAAVRPNWDDKSAIMWLCDWRSLLAACFYTRKSSEAKTPFAFAGLGRGLLSYWYNVAVRYQMTDDRTLTAPTDGTGTRGVGGRALVPTRISATI